MWRRWYDAYSGSPRAVAEMVAIGNNATLRYRSSRNEISRYILRGRDPLRIESGRQSIELVEIAVTDVPLRKGPIKAMATIFGITDAPLSPEFGSDVLDTVATLIPVPIASLNLRHDGWFIDHLAFPVVHPFSKAGAAPSEEQYSASPTLRCYETNGTKACHPQGPIPR